MVADPPRAGLGKEATAELLRLKPKRLTLVSCDPATLARDLKALLAGGYVIRKMSLVDLFPQTYHFETVVRLEIES
jgi:23S rRNA (uracil1939-C5)-methyltransferase